MILNTEFDLIWTTPWPAEKEFFFKILKNPQFAKFAKFRMKTQLFPRHALPKTFLLYTLITLVILRTAFGLILDKSLTPWKRTFFEILKNSQFAKFTKFRMKTFFPRLAITMTFWLYTDILLVILNTEFGLIWTTPWSAEKEFFLIFSKIRNSRNSQNSVWKPNFFIGTLHQFFLLYTPITLVILHTPFGLIWTTPWPDAKELFLKITEIRNSQNSQNSVWKTIFS